MKAITLRNIPTHVARAIRQRAAARGASLNKTVVEILEETVGGPQRKRTKVLHDDLNHLFGVWTDEEYREFNKALAEQRQIDPELWK